MRSMGIAVGLAIAAVALHLFMRQAGGGPDRSDDPEWVMAQETYLASLEQADGWQELEGGVLWRLVDPAGTGAKPTAEDRVRVHYEGSLVDGEVFDSSLARGKPATFRLGGVIKAWQLAIPQMRVGDTIEIAAPAELGYGPSGKGPIPGGATLLFTVELLAINPPD